MERMLNMIGVAFAAACVATVLSQAIGVGWIWYQGRLTRETLVQVMAAVHGIELEFGDDQAGGTAVPPSADQLAAAQAASNLDMDLRQQAIDNALSEFRTLRNALKKDQERYDFQRETFEKRLQSLMNDVLGNSLLEVQRTLEAIDPKQAKDQLLRMIDDPDVPREESMGHVVKIIKAMSLEKRKKLIAEFKTEDEQQQLAEILKQIRLGLPESRLIKNTSDKIRSLAEEENGP